MLVAIALAVAAQRSSRAVPGAMPDTTLLQAHSLSWSMVREQAFTLEQLRLEASRDHWGRVVGWHDWETGAGTDGTPPTTVKDATLAVVVPPSPPSPPGPSAGSVSSYTGSDSETSEVRAGFGGDEALVNELLALQWFTQGGGQCSTTLC